jgi:hypothetical protein
MIEVKIDYISKGKARELYTLLANSEYVTDARFALNYDSLSSVEVSGSPELLKILSEYYNV